MLGSVRGLSIFSGTIRRLGTLAAEAPTQRTVVTAHSTDAGVAPSSSAHQHVDGNATHPKAAVTAAEADAVRTATAAARSVGSTVASAAAAATRFAVPETVRIVVQEHSREYRDEVLLGAACLGTLALFYYWNSASVRRTKRLSEAARSEVSLRLQQLDDDMRRMKERWEADSASRETALSKAIEDNKRMTTEIDQFTQLLRQCPRR
jgi:hypothetical protein